LCKALIKAEQNYIVIYPNNDHGSDSIISNYNKLTKKDNFLIFPSIRFEYFLALLKNAKSIIGNSSCGLKEAPFFNVPTINIGTRQNNRHLEESILNCGYESHDILKAMRLSGNKFYKSNNNKKKAGINSANKFVKLLNGDNIWKVSPQKVFNDIDF
jgi:UDP-N-acetylglucosamine 2-epimerase (hydrolysing)